jgi:hypothetical protein
LDSLRRSGDVRLLQYTDSGVAVEGEFESPDVVFYLRTDGEEASELYKPVARVDKVKGIVQFVVSPNE